MAEITGIRVVQKDSATVTSRDVEFMQLLAEDKTRKEIAEKYQLSIRTVEAAFEKLKVRTGVKTMSALVAVFFRNGLIK